MKRYVIEENELDRLASISSRLLCSDRLDLDTRRDLAKAIQLIAKNARDIELPEGEP